MGERVAKGGARSAGFARSLSSIDEIAEGEVGTGRHLQHGERAGVGQQQQAVKISGRGYSAARGRRRRPISVISAMTPVITSRKAAKPGKGLIRASSM